MSSSKRSLSLPAAARRASKKATKQAVPHYSQPQAGEDDRRLLAQLMAADPGAEVGVDADADADELLPAELHQPVAVAADAPDVEAAANARAEADEITEQQSHDSAHQAEELMPHGAGVQGQQVDQQQQSLQPAPSILTVSDQTLVHQAAPTVTSPTVATGQRSKRACSNRAKQMMAVLEHDTDGEDHSPAPRRKASKKQQQDDSEFKADEPSSSSSEDEGDAASEEDEEFGMSDEDERPKKKAKKAAAPRRSSSKAAAKPRPSTGSVAAPKSGRGSAKGSGRTAQASAAGGSPGARRKPSGKAASGRAATSGKTTAAGCMAAAAGRRPAISPSAGAGATSGSSCAVGGLGSGRQAESLADAIRDGGGTSPAKGPCRTPLAQLPAVPLASTAVGTAAAVQCESSGQVSGVDRGRAVTAVSGAGPVKPAASTASHHGPGLSRRRPAGTAAAGAGSPAGNAASTASTNNMGSSTSLGGSKKQLGVRTGGRLGLGLSNGGGVVGGNGGLGTGLSVGSASGSAMGGMFGGPAFRVPGLRRPGPKKAPMTPP